MIEFFQDFSLNIFSSILLIILLISMFTKKETYRFSSRLFMRIIIAILILLILEVLSWVFDGIQTVTAMRLNFLFNTLFFMASGIVAGFFSSYVDYIIYKSRERLKKRLYYMHVSIIIIILGVINCFVPLLFTINSENIYSREPLILLGIGFVGVLMIYILGLVFLNRKKLEGNAPTIYVFVLLPFVTAVLQMVSYGLLIMWSGMALGVIIAYIFTETVNNTKDYLTKLNTRLMVGEYVERLIEKEVVFTVIMIDLDDYKSFNDNYGHSEGDKILINFSKLLSECFNENSIVSRFGGDEFVIVTQLNESNIHDNINDLISKISEFEHYPLLKEVKFSYGLSMNDTSKDMTFDSILDNADSKMYNLKAQHKNLKRRAND